MNNILQSKKIRIALIIIAACVIASVFFSAGVAVGYRKCQFTGGWYQGYRENFLGTHGMRSKMMPFREPREFLNAYSVSGAVLTNDGSLLIIETTEGVEKTVGITDKTAIRRYRNDIKLEDIKANDKVVVLGAPNEKGQIIATFIRIVDSE